MIGRFTSNMATALQYLRHPSLMKRRLPAPAPPVAPQPAFDTKKFQELQTQKMKHQKQIKS